MTLRAITSATFLLFARGVMFYCGSAALLAIGYFAGWALP